MTTRLLYLPFVGLLIFFISCGQPPRRTAKPSLPPPPRVRLKLGEYRKAAEITSENRVLVECWRQGQAQSRFHGLFRLKLVPSEGGLSLVDRNFGELSEGSSKILFVPDSETPKFRFQGKTYRGLLEIVYNPDPKSYVAINELDMESYLKGVLPAEMGERSQEEYEALKAQAVAARTYALYKLQAEAEVEFYLHSTVLDQLYHGYDSELELSSRAVEETRGQVLTYDGELVGAYYHAICGGFTEKITNVWGGKQKPYLCSVPDRDFCGWAKSYRWQETFAAEELLEKVISYSMGSSPSSPAVGDTLKSVEILSRTKSGRVRELLIETNRHEYLLKSDGIRWALNRTKQETKILPSTLFEVKLKRDSEGNITSVVFLGKGKGHGVGMCQCGAIGRSRRGFRYDQILKHYYTGTHLSKLY